MRKKKRISNNGLSAPVQMQNIVSEAVRTKGWLFT
jgi:hypothetical protein